MADGICNRINAGRMAAKGWEMSKEREEFEIRYTIPKDVEWNETRQAYCWAGRNVIAPFDDIWCAYEDGWSTRANRDQWISVDDRLPEKNQKIIAFSAHSINTTYFNGSNFGDSRGMMLDVTHWMPLPEPPEAP